MPTLCIDVKEDRRFSTTSPIAVGVWLVFFIIINVIVDLGIMYFIINIIGFVLIHMFFQFEARLIFLSYRFLIRNQVLTPHFVDKKYIYDETAIEQIARSVHPEYLKKKRKIHDDAEKALAQHKKYLDSLTKGKNND